MRPPSWWCPCCDPTFEGDVSGCHLPTSGKCSLQVVPEDVSLHDLHAAMTSDNLAQRFDHRPVELHRHDPPAELGQSDGERTHPGADLENLIVAVDTGCLRDVVAKNRVDQEVLAESMLERDPVAVEQLEELIPISWVDHH